MMEVATASPFFDARLLVTASDGTHSLFSGRRRVVAYHDRIEIAGRRIYYRWLRDLRVYGNVLHVEYVVGDGRPVTEYFAYDTFLARTGTRRLIELVDRVSEAMERTPGAGMPAPGTTQPAITVKLAERVAETKGRTTVAVYSSRVAFPPACPECLGQASSVAILATSSGLSERGSWIVPTCDRHRRIGDAIRVEFWRGDVSEVRLSFSNEGYAADFLAINSAQSRDAFRQRGTSSRLAFDLQTGAQFVVYQYAVSIVIASFLQPSGIQIVRANGSRLLRGLPWTMVSLLAGWWGIPAGPIFTIAAVIRNSRGGIDLSDTVVAVLRGESLPALAI